GLKQAKAKGVKLGRGNRKDDRRKKDEERWGMSRAELEKRILMLHKGGVGILRIGKKLGIGSGTVQGGLRPFEASATRDEQMSRLCVYVAVSRCYQCSRRTWRLRISVQAMTSMKGAHLKPPSTERFVPRQQAPISI